MCKISIKIAKEKIQEGIKIYLDKDEYGHYRLSRELQRPFFILGPAGVGKTEMAEQLAKEMNLGFVSYSMTHHTRQSVIGLPAIVSRSIGTVNYQATEYTMSEIVDAIYEQIRKGWKEGILFLDEINCVSETLSALMLQLLQKKCLGPHKIPEGWVIVAAGNPGEYNRSARTFDAVTLDRMRVLEIEPDIESWMEYAVGRGIHPLILYYLQRRPEDFYFYLLGKKPELITPRGWTDLSDAIKACEEMRFAVDIPLISQFIHKDTTVQRFSDMYDFYSNFVRLEDIDQILSGQISQEFAHRMKNEKFQIKWMLEIVLLEQCLMQAHKISGGCKTPQDVSAHSGAGQWQNQLQNCLQFIEYIMGRGLELDYFIASLMRNRDAGMLLILKDSQWFWDLYRDMNPENFSWNTLKKIKDQEVHDENC